MYSLSGFKSVSLYSTPDLIRAIFTKPFVFSSNLYTSYPDALSTLFHFSSMESSVALFTAKLLTLSTDISFLGSVFAFSSLEKSP